MNWDKRTTQRRPDAPPPRRSDGVDVIYLGLDKRAAHGTPQDAAGMQVGHSIRMMPGAALTFGRSERCDICIPSSRLSPAHALLAFLPGPDFELMLLDLETATGTWIGRRNAPLHTLGPGAELSLAQTFRFRCQPVSRISTENFTI